MLGRINFGGSAMTVMDSRAAAVTETVARIRKIEREQGVTPAALEAMKQTLISLASRTELFPAEHFPCLGGYGSIYRLSEDKDRRFALYASAGMPGKGAPPHNHTTWAVISGVFGDEHNVFYERIDNRATAGEGQLRKTGELTVKRGTAVGFLPDDFHTIQVTSDTPSLHLHMYGMSLENLPERIFFSSSTGGSYKHYPANPNIVSPLVTPAELKAMLHDGKELALLDVREEGVFSQRHLLFAGSLPLSRLELRIAALVPRSRTRIVLCDDDDGLAQRASAKLAALGYRDIGVLAGGVAGWAKAGYELFSGVHVPSKAFGEFVEHHENTPRMPAEEIKAKLDAGEDMIILDSRPMAEFTNMSIPTGIDCPGAELVYRVHDLVKSPDTLVVVNCAGRTRSIIGAQSLINAGLPNKVVALKNGTMGWHLAGYKVAKGETKHAPDPSPEGLAKAKAAAARVAERFGVRTIDRRRLNALKAERTHSTLYLFDVRSPEEYAAGHVDGTRSAPGGQLVQSTDFYVGTRNARLVLFDDNGVRATMTAHWLLQLGWDQVYVLADALAGETLVKGPEPVTVPGLAAPGPETIAPAALKAALDKGEAVVVDLENSLTYRQAHIPGAWFAIRARFADSLKKLPDAKLLVLTSPDGVLAALAAPEAAKLTGKPVKLLAGGTASWKAAGLPTEAGETHMADLADDAWYRPYDRKAGVEAAMKDYLNWELDLVAQIERDGDARFRRAPAG
jgi:rhodanese-related sulfurtransferase/predicted metal-dependent enzyme (double-stranded beta helix superfamily)